MPFFLVQNKKSNPYCPYKKTAKINTTAPLQVRKCCRLFHGKRALSWNSCQMQGSLSVEAALSLSLFLFFCFCLIMPMKMLDRQRQIQAVMESVGEELSQYAYVEYCFRSAEEGLSLIHICLVYGKIQFCTRACKSKQSCAATQFLRSDE